MQDLYIYDKYFKLLGMVETVVAFSWKRNLYTHGEFAIIAPASNKNIALFKVGNLIYHPLHHEAAEIERLDMGRDPEGMETIEIGGRFITFWLEHRIVMKAVPTRKKDDEPMSMEIAFLENCGSKALPERQIPHFYAENYTAEISGTDHEIARYITCYDIMKLTDARTGDEVWPIWMEMDTQNKRYIPRRHPGRNLSMGNSQNPPAIFSAEFENIYNQTFSLDTSMTRTTAIVTSKKELVEVIVRDDYRGFERREVYIESQVEEKNSNQEPVPIQQILNSLKSIGSYTLSKDYKEITAFTADIDQRKHLKCPEDFDLGDYVTCLEKPWGVRFDTNITEIEETWEDGVDGLYIAFSQGGNLKYKFK